MWGSLLPRNKICETLQTGLSAHSRENKYTVIDPFRQRSKRGIILNAVFNNSAQEAISTFSPQSD